LVSPRRRSVATWAPSNTTRGPLCSKSCAAQGGLPRPRLDRARGEQGRQPQEPDLVLLKEVSRVAHGKDRRKLMISCWNAGHLWGKRGSPECCWSGFVVVFHHQCSDGRLSRHHWIAERTTKDWDNEQTATCNHWSLACVSRKRVRLGVTGFLQ
jgi:hypothetical protein